MIQPSVAVERIESQLSRAVSARGPADLDAQLEGVSREALLCSQTLACQREVEKLCQPHVDPESGVDVRQDAMYAMVLGIVCFNTARLPEAETVFRTALERLPPADDDLLQSFLQSWRARIAIGLGEFAKAKDIIESEQAALKRLVLQTYVSGWFWLLCAQNLMETGPGDRVISALDQAEQIFSKFEDTRGQIEVSHARVRFLTDWGDDLGVSDGISAILELEPDVDDGRVRARRLMLIARTHMHKSMTRARKFLERASEKIATLNLPQLKFDLSHLSVLFNLHETNSDNAAVDLQNCSMAMPSGDLIARDIVQYLELMIEFEKIQNTTPVVSTDSLSHLAEKCRGFIPKSPRVAALLSLLTARSYAAGKEEASAKRHFIAAANALGRLGMRWLQIEAICEHAKVLCEEGQPLAETAQQFNRASVLATGAPALQKRVSSHLKWWMKSMDPVAACKVIADLENQRHDLLRKQQELTAPFLATIQLLLKQESSVWNAIAHEVIAKPNAASDAVIKWLRQFCTEKWHPLRTQTEVLGINIIQIAPVSVSEIVASLSKSPIRIDPQPHDSVYIHSNINWVRHGLELLSHLLHALGGQENAKPQLHIELESAHTLALRLRNPGNFTDASIMHKFLQGDHKGLRPSDLGLNSDQWPYLFTASICIEAAGGRLDFNSIQAPGQSINEFRVCFAIDGAPTAK